MWHFTQPEELIPTRHIWRFMQQAARAVGDPALATGSGRSDRQPRLLGRTDRSRSDGRCTMGSNVLPRTAHAHVQYALLAGRESRHLWLCADMGKIGIGLDEMEQCFLMQLVRMQIVRLSAGSGWRPRWSPCEPRPRRVWKKLGMLSEARIRYRNSVTAIAIPTGVLSLDRCTVTSGIRRRGKAHRRGFTRPGPPAADLAVR